MSHDKAITALKKYTKVAAHDLSIEDFVAALKGEGDRGAIILAATMIDDTLNSELRTRMPTLNSDELTRILAYDGIAGSFSSRLKLAQAMGIIDRGTRKLIELIRELRNACAHGRQEITFSTPVIREAIVSMMPAEHADDVRKWPDHQARDIFCLLCGAMCDQILGRIGTDVVQELTNLKRMEAYVSSRVRRLASPGISGTILG